MFDDNLKTTSVSFFIADFNLLSCEFDKFTFKLLFESFDINKKLIYSITYFTILLQFLVKSPTHNEKHCCISCSI